MMDMKTASEVLKPLVGQDIKILDIQSLGRGWHSEGHKVSTDKGIYFVKELATNGMGNEFVERKFYTSAVSVGMNSRSKAIPKAIGVVTAHGGGREVHLPFKPGTRVFEVQEYGGDGENLYQTFSKRDDKRSLDKDDRSEISAAIGFITELHKHKPSKENRDLLYNDYLRQVIGQPEYTLQLIQTTDMDDLRIPFRKQVRMIELMLKHMIQWKDRGDRAVQLHGDFWAANCIRRPDGTYYFIDFSRMPWGDPGFDIGFWTSTFIFNYIRTGNPYYQEYVSSFLDRYIDKTGDDEVRKTLIFPQAMLAIAYAKPDYVPGFDDSARKAILRYAFNVMEKGVFNFPGKGR